MENKSQLRKKYLFKRKKLYFKINNSFLKPIIKLIKNKSKNKKVKIAIYYPSLYEVDILCILDNEILKKNKFLLPIIEKNHSMNFYKFSKKDILKVNEYGMLEPFKSKNVIPEIIFVPLLAFDVSKNRLGYGKGFYDRYLFKYLKINKNILTVGVAFSFQKHHNLPVNNKDIKLDYILTEKGLFNENLSAWGCYGVIWKKSA